MAQQPEHAIGQATAELSAIMREFINQEAETAERVNVQVQAGEVQAQMRQGNQPGTMTGPGLAGLLTLGVNVASLLPFIDKLAPSLSQVALAWLERKYGPALRALLGDHQADVQRMLSTQQWDAVRGLIDLVDPQTLGTVVHPKIMGIVRR